MLVVDDAVAPRDRLCALLVEGAAAQVEGTAADTTVVMARMLAFQPHCVVIDVPVAGPSGFELLEAVTTVGVARLVIVSTNQTSEELRRRCLSLGAHAFLAKSTDFERITGLVSALPERP